MGSIQFITPEWKAWVRKTLASGYDRDSILQVMISRDFDPFFASAVIYLLEDESRVHNLLDTGVPKPSDYLYETPRFPQEGSFIELSDRRVRVVARFDKPVVAIVENVLSDAECNELIALSQGKLERSLVLENGEQIVSEIRTSEGTFFERNEHELISRLDQRIAELMHWPIDHGEPMQILKYGVGAEYTPHFDYFVENEEREMERGGQRISTLVLYLSDVEEGGETVFPDIGLSVSPKKGSAVYFEYGNSLGQLDPLSLHGGKPVRKGEKWIATRWMRQRPFVK